MLYPTGSADRRGFPTLGDDIDEAMVEKHKKKREGKITKEENNIKRWENGRINQIFINIDKMVKNAECESASKSMSRLVVAISRVKQITRSQKCAADAQPIASIDHWIRQIGTKKRGKRKKETGRHFFSVLSSFTLSLFSIFCFQIGVSIGNRFV